MKKFTFTFFADNEVDWICEKSVVAKDRRTAVDKFWDWAERSAGNVTILKEEVSENV